MYVTVLSVCGGEVNRDGGWVANKGTCTIYNGMLLLYMPAIMCLPAILLSWQAISISHGWNEMLVCGINCLCKDDMLTTTAGALRTRPTGSSSTTNA